MIFNKIPTTTFLTLIISPALPNILNISGYDDNYSKPLYERHTIYLRVCSVHGYPESKYIDEGAVWFKVKYIYSNVSSLDVQLYVINTSNGELLYRDTSNYVGEVSNVIYANAESLRHIHHHVYDGIAICSLYRYTIINN